MSDIASCIAWNLLIGYVGARGSVLSGSCVASLRCFMLVLIPEGVLLLEAGGNHVSALCSQEWTQCHGHKCHVPKSWNTGKGGSAWLAGESEEEMARGSKEGGHGKQGLSIHGMPHLNLPLTYSLFVFTCS